MKTGWALVYGLAFVGVVCMTWLFEYRPHQVSAHAELAEPPEIQMVVVRRNYALHGSDTIHRGSPLNWSDHLVVTDGRKIVVYGVEDWKLAPTSVRDVRADLALPTDSERNKSVDTPAAGG